MHHVVPNAQLYSVNRVSVQSGEANVFTENQREVLEFEHESGLRFAIVAVGATVVGSSNGNVETII